MPSTSSKAHRLSGLRIAVLSDNGFEQSELTDPINHLTSAGASISVISPARQTICGWDHTDWGITVRVDIQIEKADPQQFDALILPGGVMNPDRLRMNSTAVAFVKHFLDAGKPIAAICHGPWTLINAGGVSGRHLTSWPSLRLDLENAGAIWHDEEVVCDGPLITSRKPSDLPAFNEALMRALELRTAEALRH